MVRTASLLALATALGCSRPASAQESLLDRPRAAALGFQLDALPTVLSAAHGRPGLGPQIWYGVSGLRARLVFAHLEPPDAFAKAPTGFRDARIDAYGAIVDYTFGPRYDGPWLGAGYEVWVRSIAHEDVPGRTRWTQLALTFGGGYIFRFGKTFYVDPWLGAHVLESSRQMDIGGHPYRPAPMEVEASVKLGCVLSL